MNRISKVFLLACVVLTMFAFTSCGTLKGESDTKTGATVSISGTGTTADTTGTGTTCTD